MSRSHLEVKGQNDYCLIGSPCPAGISTMHHRFQRNLAQTFTMMKRLLAHKTQAYPSNVKVTLRGQNEYCLIKLPCPAHISTMHHRIPKLLGTHVHLKCQGHTQMSKLVLFDRTVPCPTRILTMHHRISMKLGTNIHYDEAACRSQDPGLSLKCQNENFVRTASQPCIIGFPNYQAQIQNKFYPICSNCINLQNNLTCECLTNLYCFL